MKDWKELQEDVIKVRLNKEMAKSLTKMMGTRLKAAESLDKEKFASMLVDLNNLVKPAINIIDGIIGMETEPSEPRSS